MMPDLALETPDGGTVNPSDFRGQKLVIFFYPKDDTPGCTTEAKDFTAFRGEFDRAGAALLGVSKDLPAKHQRFIVRHGLTVPLASDAAEGGLSDALGIWTEKKNNGRDRKSVVEGKRGSVGVDLGGRRMHKKK